MCEFQSFCWEVQNGTIARNKGAFQRRGAAIHTCSSQIFRIFDDDDKNDDDNDGSVTHSGRAA